MPRSAARNITVNKNAVPNDPRPPMITSGLRIGSPAATTRGFKEAEVRRSPDWIADVLDANGAEPRGRARARRGRRAVPAFPVYGKYGSQERRMH
jgi:glycine hydroxymethyltransferase